MRRITRFSIAKQDIVAFFESLPVKVFKSQDLSEIFERNRAHWRLAKTMSHKDFIEEMTSKTRLKVVELPFPTGTLTRYVYESPDPYQLALSLKPKAYLSHYTALFLHQLTEQLPKTLYVTFEQSPKTITRPALQQQEIDQAFAREQRISQNHIAYGGYTFYLLNGKHTGNEGIISLSLPEAGNVLVTNLERTLIDIAVRPAYSGGIGEVLKAYEQAREKVSVNKLNAMLTRLEFVYPYHQAIGFYMEKAGYREAQLDLLRKRGFSHDFYLTYNMKEMEYAPDWRLYYPKGF